MLSLSSHIGVPHTTLPSKQQKSTRGTPKSCFHASRLEMYVVQLIPKLSYRAELQYVDPPLHTAQESPSKHLKADEHNACRCPLNSNWTSSSLPTR